MVSKQKSKDSRNQMESRHHNTIAHAAAGTHSNSMDHLLFLPRRTPNQMVKMHLLNCIELARGLREMRSSCCWLHCTCPQKMIGSCLKRQCQCSFRLFAPNFQLPHPQTKTCSAGFVETCHNSTCCAASREDHQARRQRSG